MTADPARDGGRPRRHPGAALRLGLLLLGAGLLAYLATTVGPETLLGAFQALGWHLLLVVWFPMVLVAALDTLGWRYAFPVDRASFARLFLARMAGEAFNVTTPTASLGGEPVKAYLLRPRVPLDEGLASVIIAKTTLSLAQGVFLLLGLALAVAALPAGSPLLTWMAALAVAGAVSVAGLLLLQQGGVVTRGVKVLAGLGLPVLERRREGIRRLDGVLATFYRAHRGRLLASCAWHLLGWLAGSLEVYLILHWLDRPVSLGTAVAIEAFTTAIKSAAFLVPAALGALEGGSMAVFAAFGLGGGFGLGVTLVRRVRELLWVVAGLLALWRWRG